MANFIASIFASALEAIPRSNISGRNTFSAVVQSILRTPLKVIAAFLFAPFLIFRIARHATDPKRKWLAAIGLFIGSTLSIAAGTFLGWLTTITLAG